MLIGELSGKVGLDVETVRYYEKAGLLPRPKRLANGYRAYGSEHLERLAFIRHCRALDMSLGNIRELIGFMDKPPADCGPIDALVDDQLRVVRARIKSLRALEKQLALLRARCQSGERARCGILDELVAAAHGEACACHA